MSEKKLLLDTCALLWLAAGSGELTVAAKTAIEQASLVMVSPISAWEISLKATEGDLALPLESEQWFRQAINHHNITLTALDADILMAANRLPWHHRDPTDRFIIATAIQEKATVVTADRRFKQYGVKVIV